MSRWKSVNILFETKVRVRWKNSIEGNFFLYEGDLAGEVSGPFLKTVFVIVFIPKCMLMRLV